MILTDEMLMAAFRYREAKLWESLDDSNIFAFRLSDGETGYCCVMGHGGEHFALGFYRGAKGFTTYLKTIRMCDMSKEEGMELSLTFDCINCDFMNSSDTQGLDKEAKAYIREFTKNNGLRMRRPNGWPDFTRYVPYRMPSGITDERDAKDITEALNAAVAVADRLNVGKGMVFNEKVYAECGFDLKFRYPSQGGGKAVPFLIPQEDGTYEWSMTKLPAVVKDVFPKTGYDNMIVAARLKAMAHKDTLQCRVIYLPVATEKDGNNSYFTSMLLCCQEESQYVFPAMSAVSVDEDPLQTLNSFATILLKMNTCPATIVVSDGKTKALLADFCRKTGIKLQTVKKMPELESAWGYMMECYMHGI